MKSHVGKTRSFYQLSRGWPEQRNSPNRDRYLDEIMIGFYAPSGASSGEFAIRWYDVGKDIMPRLEAFDDSWHALAQCADLLAALAQHDSETITPSQVCELLNDLGFIDRTPIARP